MSKALPARPHIDWLKKAAKQQLDLLREREPTARLHQAQYAIARDYGFASWRALKAHVDALSGALPERDRVFDAARAGDIEAVRQAFASGFDPATPDRDGRTIHQIAKELQHEAIELLARDVQGGPSRPIAEQDAIQGIAGAAQSGDTDALRALLDAHPDLVNALAGRGFQKATALHLAALRNRHAAIRLLIERGADLDSRDFPDNAAPLHFAAAHGDLETLRLLVEAGADVDGKGDDHGVGVLGWATCFNAVRQDVADHLLAHGARLNLWTAIALDRAETVRAMIAAEPSLLTARMTRNQHRRLPLHHAAARNRPAMVRLLLDLGADPNAHDATGATPLTTAAQEGSDAGIIDMLMAAGATPDFLTALNLERYDLAEALLRDDPTRIGPDGRDTIALHLAVARRKYDTVRWLIDHGAAVSAKRRMWDCDHTALHMTMENGDADMTRLLLAAGADPNVRDGKYNVTVLKWADFFGRPELAALVRDKGGH